jgi:lysyl-tRNA synthetase class 2
MPTYERLVERFEPFVCRMEIGNDYSELTDPVDQLGRFMAQRKVRSQATDKEYEDNPLDADFVNAIGCGMPPTGGVGLGVDRLITLLTGSSNIRDIIPFPMIKPQKS